MHWYRFLHIKGKPQSVFARRERPSFGRITDGMATMGLVGFMCGHLLCSLWFHRCISWLLFLQGLWFAGHEDNQIPEAVWAPLRDEWVSQGDKMSCSEPKPSAAECCYFLFSGSTHTYFVLNIARGRDLQAKAPAWGYSAQLSKKALVYSAYPKIIPNLGNILPLRAAVGPQTPTWPGGTSMLGRQ